MHSGQVRQNQGLCKRFSFNSLQNPRRAQCSFEVPEKILPYLLTQLQSFMNRLSYGFGGFIIVQGRTDFFLFDAVIQKRT